MCAHHMKCNWLFYFYTNYRFHPCIHTYVEKSHELSYKTDYKHRKKIIYNATSNFSKCSPSFESKKKTTCLSELFLSTGEC